MKQIWTILLQPGVPSLLWVMVRPVLPQSPA